MIRIYTLLCILLIARISNAQEPIEIGKTIDNEYLVSADTSVLRKAMQKTLGDGTQILSFKIESLNSFHYLIGTGILKGHYKMMAAQLKYDMKSRSFYAVPQLPHVTCSSAACDQCKPFKELGKIIGCKCEEKSTVSNQCNFNMVELSPFYDAVKRYIAMKHKG